RDQRTEPDQLHPGRRRGRGPGFGLRARRPGHVRRRPAGRGRRHHLQQHQVRHHGPAPGPERHPADGPVHGHHRRAQRRHRQPLPLDGHRDLRPADRDPGPGLAEAHVQLPERRQAAGPLAVERRPDHRRGPDLLDQHRGPGARTEHDRPGPDHAGRPRPPAVRLRPPRQAGL
ncbi:hypothetical protein HK102_012526, partial [Quaeritorhiza haematococci]